MNRYGYDYVVVEGIYSIGIPHSVISIAMHYRGDTKDTLKRVVVAKTVLSKGNRHHISWSELIR